MSSESDDDFHDVESSFNQSLEDNTVEGAKRAIKNQNNSAAIEQVTDLLGDCKVESVENYKLDGSTIVYIDSHDEEEVVVEGHIQVASEQTLAMANDNQNNQPAAPAAVDYDKANTADGDKAQDYARAIKIEYEPANIKFWFSQLEGEMLMASVGSQWLKKTILQRNLPNKQKMDVMALLTLTQAEAGDTIYFDIKSELLRIYAQKPQDSYKVALTRTMTGLPSQLGHQIVQDICKKSKKLEGCCCDAATFALWSIQLPVNIRAHISNMTFNSTTYKDVFEQADKVYLSAKQISVAALALQGGQADLDETQPAFLAQNQPQEVAAMKSQPAKNKKNKNNKNKGKGQGQGQKKPRGPRHSSSPPESCCDRHYVHGPDAWYCLQPTTCPWVNRITPKA